MWSFRQSTCCHLILDKDKVSPQKWTNMLSAWSVSNWNWVTWRGTAYLTWWQKYVLTKFKTELVCLWFISSPSVLRYLSHVLFFYHINIMLVTNRNRDYNLLHVCHKNGVQTMSCKILDKPPACYDWLLTIAKKKGDTTSFQHTHSTTNTVKSEVLTSIRFKHIQTGINFSDRCCVLIQCFSFTKVQGAL